MTEPKALRVGPDTQNLYRSVNYKLSHARLCDTGPFQLQNCCSWNLLLRLDTRGRLSYSQKGLQWPKSSITIPLPTLELKLCFKRKFLFPFSLRVHIHIHTYTVLILLLIFADTTSSSCDTLSCFYLKFEKAGILFYYLVSHFKDHFIIWSTFISLSHISLRTPEKYKYLES